MKTAGILLFSGNDLVGRVIKWRTGGEYSHVAILVDGVLYEAIRSGVRKLEGEDAWKRVQEAKDVIDFEAQEDDLARAMEWLEAQVGRSYAFWEIVLIALFGRLPNSWACPSLTTAFLRIAGPLKDGLNDRTETPSGIAERLGRVPPPGFEPGTSSV